MLREEAPRKSRRELRREREQARGGFARRVAGRRGSRASKLQNSGDLYREDGLPKSRRAVREFYEQRRKKKVRGGVREILVTILVAFVLVFGVVRPFVVEAYRIPSESMVPTLEVGDRVLANKFIYNFAEPERGDVVIFESVEGGEETLIKRVVGLPGDSVRLRPNGQLVINREPQDEPYLNESGPARAEFDTETVPEGHVFVMGDNRNNSGDSRLFGPVPLENVKGEAFVRFWPIPKIEPFFGDPERGAS